jgi:AraC family transcriptional regulator, ethanolamine operon transcriptional activator
MMLTAMPTEAQAKSSFSEATKYAAAYSYRKYHAEDADEHADNLKDWDQSYDQVSAGRFNGSLVDAWFNDIQIFREITNQSVIQTGSCCSESLLFGIPLSMEGTGIFCDQPLPQGAIFSLDSNSEFTLRTPKNFDVIGIAIRQTQLDNFIISTDDGMALGHAPRLPTVVVESRHFGELRRFLRTLCDVLDTDPTLLAHAQVQRTLSSALLGHLLASTQSAIHGPTAPPSYQARKAIVERAREYTLSHVDELVTVAELVEVIGVSRRTLQYCFQDVFNTNPVQYLRGIRLNGARRELRNRNSHTTHVQDVAARWGFWHLSHFSTDYRTMFGELPSETLRKAQ